MAHSVSIECQLKGQKEVEKHLIALVLQVVDSGGPLLINETVAEREEAEQVQDG